MPDVFKMLCAVALLAGGLVGCASGPGAMADSVRAPEDFALAVTVFPPEDSIDPVGLEDLPRAQRPAHYLIGADGVLHTSVGLGVSPARVPRPTRRVPAEERDRLWRLVDESGILREDNPFAVDAPLLYQRFDRRSTALVEVTGGGTTEAVAIDLEAQDPDSSAAWLLVDRLAALSWIRP